MWDIPDLISWLYTLLFVLLAVVVTVDWLRRRERGQGVLSLPVISLASATGFGQGDGLGNVGAPVWFAGAFAGIILGAHGLFLFRDSFVPSRTQPKRLTGIGRACGRALGHGVGFGGGYLGGKLGRDRLDRAASLHRLFAAPMAAPVLAPGGGRALAARARGPAPALDRPQGPGRARS